MTWFMIELSGQLSTNRYLQTVAEAWRSTSNITNERMHGASQLLLKSPNILGDQKQLCQA